MTLGRKPTPNAILKLRGSYRKSRHGDRPDLKPGIPRRPSWLGPDAKTEWKRLVAILGDLGVLTLVDRTILAMHCQSFDDYLKAKEVVDSEGSTIVGAAGTQVEHPALRIMHKAFDRMLKTGLELGLTPASRCRVKVVKPPEVDELDAFIAEGRKKKA